MISIEIYQSAFKTGPFRWICTSGDPVDLRLSDRIACKVLEDIRTELVAKQNVDDYAGRALPQVNDNLLWIREAEKHQLVVGSQVNASTS